MGIKRDKFDDVFSKFIRTRAKWFCEKCGKYFPEGNRAGLHCSHMFGRRNITVRYHPDNAFSHCVYCHKYLSENPVEFAQWAEKILGKETIAKVQEIKLNKTGIKKREVKTDETYKQLKAWLKGAEDEL